MKYEEVYRESLASPESFWGRAAEEIGRMRGAGEGEMSTEEILALTRR